jgi:hypothetical protein
VFFGESAGGVVGVGGEVSGGCFNPVVVVVGVMAGAMFDGVVGVDGDSISIG